MEVNGMDRTAGRSESSENLPESNLSPATEITEVKVEQIPSKLPMGGYGIGSMKAIHRPLTVSDVLHFRWTILLTFLIITVPSIFAIWMFVAPEYQVTGQIRVRPIIPRLVFKTDDNGPIQYYNSYLDTQVTVITSPSVLQRVLELPEIQETAWYRKKKFTLIGIQPSPMDRLLKSLQVRPRGRTEVIDVSLVDPDPREASLIVNSILKNYISMVRESLDQTDDIMYKKLMEEYTTLRNEIEGREQLAAKLRKELGTGTPDNLISQRRMRMDELESELEKLRRSIAAYEWQIKTLKSKHAELASDSSTTQPTNLHYQADGEWRKLYSSWRTNQAKIEVERSRLGESHPKMIELVKNTKLMEDLMKSRQRYLDGQMLAKNDVRLAAQEVGTGLGRNIHVLEEQLQQLKNEEALLLRDLKNEQSVFEKVFDTAQMLARENETITYKREVYEKVRNRLNEKEMERNVPGSIEILAQASPPSEPESDRRLFYTVMAILGGLGLGSVIAFFRASTSQTINEAADLHHSLRMPFLGQIPYSRYLAEGTEMESQEMSECIRMIRTSLLQRLGRDRGNAILITSACSGAGKSTLAVMLAKTLTQCGKSVLLIDTDIRKHSLAKKFGLNPDPGLLSVLIDQMADEEAIVKSDLNGLDFLPAGHGWSSTDQELLANGTFSRCLDRWRKKYDVIMLDSSPILPVADARIICRQIDGAVMVVQKGHCRRCDVIDALCCIEAAGGKLLGTVFIGSNAHSYNYEYSRTNIITSELTERWGV
jgi:capsular exopolysaccharide synthesis family protein